MTIQAQEEQGVTPKEDMPSKRELQSATPPSTNFLDELDEDSSTNGACSRSSSNLSRSSKGARKWITRKIKQQEEDVESSGEQELSKRESKHVFRLRMLVIAVLSATAVAVSAAVYQFTTQSEIDEFEGQYEGAAGKVVETFEDIMDRMGSVSSLGMSLTSYGMDHKSETDWPFVTLSSFPQKADQARKVSGALMVTMSHLVASDTFDAWNDFVTQPEESNWM